MFFPVTVQNTIHIKEKGLFPTAGTSLFLVLVASTCCELEM